MITINFTFPLVNSEYQQIVLGLDILERESRLDGWKPKWGNLIHRVGRGRRKDAGYISNRMLTRELPGKWKRGMPKQKFMYVIKADMWTVGDAEDAEKWRRKLMVRCDDLTESDSKSIVRKMGTISLTPYATETPGGRRTKKISNSTNIWVNEARMKE